MFIECLRLEFFGGCTAETCTVQAAHAKVVNTGLAGIAVLEDIMRHVTGDPDAAAVE
jgi:thiamine monophosphate synthase